MVFSAAVAGTVGLSSRVVAQPEREPTDAELEAKVDARLHEVMRAVLAGQRSEARTAALAR
ncbi:hypothetical protein [Hyalangium gracile]|uniref:hypothetical protein n=1 Tax=Hyalangium gracile TaxID=394092 RepID=UPI001CCA1AD3|nr:hypothetical protein [Hyalangium gracile]